MAVMSLHRKLFFLLVLFLPTQLGFHFWPDWATILGRKIDFLSPTVYFTDFIIFAMLVFWLLENQRYRSILTSLFSINLFHKCILIGTGVYVFFNILFAHSANVAFISWIKLLECILLGVYVYQQRISFSDIIKPLAIGTFIASIVGISQYVFQRSIGGVLWFLGERSFVLDTPAIARVTICRLFSTSCELRLRAYSTFSHPNVFGGYLAITLPLLLVEVLKNIHSTVKRNIYGSVYVLGVVALVLCFSRSAWIVSTFGMICIISLRQKIVALRLPLILALCGVVFVGFLVAPIQDESFIVRQQLNTASIAIWQRSPYIGVGLNNFLFGLSPTLQSHQVYVLQPVHNVYLLALSQMGVIGLSLAWIYVMVFVKSVGGVALRFSPLYISVLSLFLLGIVDHYLFTLQQGQLLFSVMTAMSAVAIKFPSKS